MMTATMKKLTDLREASRAGWVECVETYHDNADRQAAARAAKAYAMEAWGRALGALHEGQFDRATMAMDEARALGAEWGEDADEREALAMLDARNVLGVLSRAARTNNGVADIMHGTTYHLSPIETVTLRDGMALWCRRSEMPTWGWTDDAESVVALLSAAGIESAPAPEARS